MKHTRRFSRLMIVAMLLSLLLGLNGVVSAQTACSPYSLLACNQLRVPALPNYELNWNINHGGLVDNGGIGTGFTAVAPATNPETGGAAQAPSYLANKLVVNTSTGLLSVTGTPGLNVNVVNTQMNALAVGVPTGNSYIVEARIKGLNLSAGNAAFQQAGIWFGTGEDDYFKLVMVRNTAGTQIEFGRETAGVYDTQSRKITLTAAQITAIQNGSLRLILTINSVTNTASAQYQIDTGAIVDVTPTYTGAGFNTTTVNGVTVGGIPMTFAGIMVSQRNNTVAPVAQYDNFKVTRTTNTAPVASNDAYSVDADTTLNVNAANGVLANDSDPNGDPLTAQLVQTTTNGTLTLNPNGSFTYTPNTGYFGTDTFTYTAFDGGLNSNTATVTITVNDTISPPVAVNDAYSVDEDNVLIVNAANGVLANDQRVGSGVATVVTPPSSGTFALQPSGAFTYTPLANFNGTDTFTYRITGNPNGLSNIATVTITVNPVNDPPVAVNDTYSVVVDNVLTVPASQGVLANDFDVDGDPLTVVSNTNPTNGSLVLNADGSFTYTPNTGFIGQDTFNYTISDGQLTATATVTINVVNASVELLGNNSFENQGNAQRDASGWFGTNLLNGDRRVCNPNRAYTGNCAFRLSYVGASNFVRTIAQSFTTPFTAQPGDNIVVNAYVRANNLTPGASIRVVVRYQDGTRANMSIILPVGTYNYQPFTRTMPLTKPVRRISVQVQYDGKQGNGGVLFVDDVSLKLNQMGGSGFATSLGESFDAGSELIPLPEAPADMRGN